MSNTEFKLKTKKELKEMHLSDQALGAVMMALQKSLMEQSDIVPVLKNFKLVEDDAGNLVITNPPLVKFSHDDADVLTEMTDTED